MGIVIQVGVILAGLITTKKKKHEKNYFNYSTFLGNICKC